MRTIYPPRYRIHRALFLALCLPPIVIGCVDLDFDGFTESTGQTYDQYVANKGDAWFEPKGASDISQRTSSTRDGYDAWWRFSISESDFLATVTAVAEAEHGPSEIQLEASAILPPQWNAESDVPTWWKIDGGKNPQSIHWCFKAGTSERHHGWLFVYNQESNTAWCWHWNHQWSSSECP